MKVGIMTWFYADNYGARAHSFALQEIIKAMGHECVMIALYPPHLLSMNIRMNLNYENRKKHPFLAFKCLSRNAMFMSARNKMYNISDRVYSSEDIDNLKLDAIVLGSDEVFKVGHPFFNELYYGVGINTPLITYAPSAGQTPDDYILPERIVKSIDHYRALSVRDKHTYDLLYRSTNKKAQIVLDPTLLYDFKGITKKTREEDYVLIYSFDGLDEYKSRIMDYAMDNRLKIICIGRYCSWADISYVDIEIQKWLGMFQNARLVVTDSFHGTVFAIKNRRRFVILGREDKINKISDLMSECGINLSFYEKDNSISSYLAEPFSYDEIDSKIAEKKQISIAYLEDALSKIKGEIK